MKCQWQSCGGLINPETDRCIMCGRTTDVAFEEMIETKKALANFDWQHSGKIHRKPWRRKYAKPELP